MKAVVFSGTSEGREIIEYLNGAKIFTEAFVATKYGKTVMPDMEYISVKVGRLNKDGVKKAVFGADFVIDATHPYAEIITKNISSACSELKIEYIRILREESFYFGEGVISANSIEQAADILNGTKGNIFLSTGSRDIFKYARIKNYKERITARVLPVKEAEEKCRQMGLKNVIYKKGPFSYSENASEFEKYNIKWLVTKNSGKSGGFYEKISAAKDKGVKTIVIRRPVEEKGMSVAETKNIIDEKAKISRPMRFPFFIDISGKKAVVIGGGKVAARRIKALLKFGAEVKAVSPEFYLQEKENGAVYVRKNFEPQDIDGAFIVIAASSDRKTNHFIYTLCRDKNIFYNTADCKEECNFYFPAVCVNDKLSIGIVSDGNNHKLVKETAKKIREDMTG